MKRLFQLCILNISSLAWEIYILSKTGKTGKPITLDIVGVLSPEDRNHVLLNYLGDCNIIVSNVNAFAHQLQKELKNSNNRIKAKFDIADNVCLRCGSTNTRALVTIRFAVDNDLLRNLYKTDLRRATSKLLDTNDWQLVCNDCSYRDIR